MTAPNVLKNAESMCDHSQFTVVIDDEHSLVQSPCKTAAVFVRASVLCVVIIETAML